MKSQTVDPVSPAPSDDLNDYVERFESACEDQPASSLDLAGFLPPRSHFLYLTVLCELVRIDLEHGWEARQPRPLDWYQERFPELFADPAALQAIAFEEFRLRRRAGEAPAAADYAQRYGIDTLGWSTLEGADARSTAANSQAQLCEVAQAYREHSQMRHDLGSGSNGSDLEEWLARHPSLDGPGRQFFLGLHRDDPQQAARMADGLVKLPEVGEEIFGFRLIKELGRGAFGRVFLAHQGDLANRPVALKVAPDVGGESQTLAQLQHTHIVPIYSVHRAESLQGVCMPYFGAVTLADVLRELNRRQSLPKSGLEVLSTLGPNLRTQPTVVRGSASAEAKPGAGPTASSDPCSLRTTDSGLRAHIERLKKMNYADAVLWLGSCLADGLAHAHDRGILHRDLKPANVLLTDEGQPMLLDFNLAEDVKQRAHAFRAQVGGTLPYMAPEHLRAFRGDDMQVDERSDVFSLGVLLYQMLTGQPAYPTADFLAQSAEESPQLMAWIIEERSQLPASVRSLNPSLTPATAAIIERCLQPDPAQRYQSAHELQEDLQLQLEHFPLRHAPDRHLLERSRKWLRRHPHALSRTALVLTPLLLLLALAIFLQFARLAREETERATLQAREEAERAALLAQEQDAKQNVAQFRSAFPTIQFLLYTRSNIPGQVEDGQVRCRAELDRYGVLTDPEWRSRPRFTSLALDERERLEQDLGELLYLLVRAEIRLHNPKSDVSTPKPGVADTVADSSWRERALEWNQQALALFPRDDAPPAFWKQRHDLLKQLGRNEEAKAAGDKGSAPPRTARAMYLDAHLLTLGEDDREGYRPALRLLYHATELESRSFWIWMLMGICHEAMGDEDRAHSCFDASVRLAPECFGGHFQRGLMHLRRFEYPQAEQDFTRVLALQSPHADAHLQRALARQAQKQFAGAVADLDAALAQGASPANIYSLRSRARRLLGDTKGAQEDYERCLTVQPRDDVGWIARGADTSGTRSPGGARRSRRGAEAQSAVPLGAAKQGVDPRCVPASRKGRPHRARSAHRGASELRPGPHRPRRAASAGRASAASACRRREGPSPRRSRQHPLPGRMHLALTSKQEPGDASAALLCLRLAVAHGFGREHLETDHDLDPLRDNPDFQRWLAELPRRGSR